MAEIIPAAPGWYVTVIATRKEKGRNVRYHDERPVIAWQVADADAGALLPIVANPRPGSIPPTLVPDMTQEGRRLIYRKR